MSQINSLSDITINGLCIGCGICQSLVGTDKISISMSEKGRLEPKAIKPLSNLEFEKLIFILTEKFSTFFVIICNIDNFFIYKY